MDYLAWIAAIFLCQASSYMLAKPLQKGRRHRTVRCRWDGRVPVAAGAVWVYLGCYLWWWISMALCLGDDRFAAAALFGYLIACLVFVLYPTRMEGRELVTAGGLTGLVLQVTFACDSPENLLPSVHVFISALCMIPAWRQGGWWLALSVILFFAVCWSTLALRQHYLPDLVAGAALAVFSWYLAALPVLQRLAGAWTDLFLRLVN